MFIGLTLIQVAFTQLSVYFIDFYSLSPIFLDGIGQIEDEKSCSYDHVDIYGGLDDYSGPLYGRYCGLNVSYFEDSFECHFMIFFFFKFYIRVLFIIVETSGCHFDE